MGAVGVVGGLGPLFGAGGPGGFGSGVFGGIGLEAFEPEFMQRALLAGLVAAVACSVVGTWIVLRGLTFLGDALAHGVLPGLALATTWGFNPVLGALASALVMSGAVTVVGRRAAVRDDVGIGLLFVGMLALDADKARTLGMRPALAHAAMLVVLAVAIVASFSAIGTLLVFGLLIGPPATAGLVVRRVPTRMLVAVGFGASAVVIGLLVSFHHGTAGGASIAAVAVGQFFAVLVLRDALVALRSRRAVTVAP